MTEKRIYILFLILFCALLTVNNTFGQKVKTVVLDAGHGGHDTGALGKNSREKDIALAIVLKLRDYIRENLKDIKVVTTRDDDTFVELYRRARIANENKADLFISVHCNAVRTSTVNGAETFVMGLNKSAANLAVAKAENAAILLEDNYVEQYDGFDPGSPEGNIFFSMMQNAFLDRSLDFASRVQHQLVDNLNLSNRGVKQDGFLVLYKTAMPAVLIETGFISNPKDEKFLLSEKGQDQMAEAIFKSLRDYHGGAERKNYQEPSTTDNQILKPQFAEIESKTLEKALTADSISKQQEEKKEFTFRVQFKSYPEARPVSSPGFKGIADVKMYFHKGLYKFTSGDFATFEQASKHRVELIKKGYKDAFVVAFRGQERISDEESKALQRKKE